MAGAAVSRGRVLTAVAYRRAYTYPGSSRFAPDRGALCGAIRVVAAAVLVQSVVQRLQAYAQQFGGLALATPAVLQGRHDHLTLDILQRRAHGELQQGAGGGRRLLR